MSQKLIVPSVARQQPADMLDEEARWRLLRRCLTDDMLRTDVRAAGALTLLFGLAAERIRHLTADQLTRTDGQDFLAVDRRPMLLPPRLAKLLRRRGTDPNAASRSDRTRGSIAVAGGGSSDEFVGAAAGIGVYQHTFWPTRWPGRQGSWSSAAARTVLWSAAVGGDQRAVHDQAGIRPIRPGRWSVDRR